MVIAYVDIAIENFFLKRKLETRVLVDSGFVFFARLQHLAVQIILDLIDAITCEVALAEGSGKPVVLAK